MHPNDRKMSLTSDDSKTSENKIWPGLADIRFPPTHHTNKVFVGVQTTLKHFLAFNPDSFDCKNCPEKGYSN